MLYPEPVIDDLKDVGQVDGQGEHGKGKGQDYKGGHGKGEAEESHASGQMAGGYEGWNDGVGSEHGHGKRYYQ